MGTKVKTPGTGKNIGEALQAPILERLCKLHDFLVQGSCLVSNIFYCQWVPQNIKTNVWIQPDSTAAFFLGIRAMPYSSILP
jgi:hypothetical protein